MQHDHRPYWIKQLHRAIEARYTQWRLAPAFAAFGKHAQVMKPWFVQVSGRSIAVGKAPHIIAGRDRPVSLTTWTINRDGVEIGGRIDIGDFVLFCPGVRIDSGAHIQIGDNCMFAANAYVTDADWHGLYDRTEVIGNAAKVMLDDNVWIGDGATVCKGVHIGENSIVGAGAVVTKDVPANVVVAGNPASIVKELDPTRTRRRRAELLGDHAELTRWTSDVERLQLAGNTTWKWLRHLLLPRRGD